MTSCNRGDVILVDITQKAPTSCEPGLFVCASQDQGVM